MGSNRLPPANDGEQSRWSFPENGDSSDVNSAMPEHLRAEFRRRYDDVEADRQVPPHLQGLTEKEASLADYPEAAEYYRLLRDEGGFGHGAAQQSLLLLGEQLHTGNVPSREPLGNPTDLSKLGVEAWAHKEIGGEEHGRVIAGLMLLMFHRGEYVSGGYLRTQYKRAI